MGEPETYGLWKILLGIAGVTLLYYGGTRGVLALTRAHAGRWYRRFVVALSFAALFSPSIVGIGAHGGFMPVPAWVTAIETASRGRWVDFITWGLAPIAATWVIFFVAASMMSQKSNNKNKKVDTNGKET
jgi:hypothetical protein